jgi:hypothetical protein
VGKGVERVVIFTPQQIAAVVGNNHNEARSMKAIEDGWKKEDFRV